VYVEIVLCCKCQDPASRIKCRTGIRIRPTAFFIIHQRYHKRYCIMSISPVCRRRTTLHQLPFVNLNLDHILQWSSRYGLSINATESQAMLVNPRLLQLGDACQILLDDNTIDFYQKVKNLGLMMNSKLTWDAQLSKICRNVFFTLKRLWPHR
jgi:hypothetical protein